MTKQQLEKRRKVVKVIGVALPVSLILLALVKGNGKDAKIGLAIAGGITGLILAGVVAVSVLPSVEQQQKIK